MIFIRLIASAVFSLRIINKNVEFALKRERDAVTSNQETMMFPVCTLLFNSIQQPASVHIGFSLEARGLHKSVINALADG